VEFSLMDRTSIDRILEQAAMSGGAKTSRLGPGETFHPITSMSSIVTRKVQALHRVKIERPLLVAVLAGTKTVCCAGVTQRFDSGSLLLFPSGLEMDFENRPSACARQYAALILEIDDRILARMRYCYPKLTRAASSRNGCTGPLVLVKKSPPVDEAFSHLLHALAPQGRRSDAIVEHRTLEMLITFAENGVDLGLLYGRDLAARARACLRSEPSRPWTLKDLAHTVGTSVSTLKRRLVADGGGWFRAVLAEERLSAAHTLIDCGASVTEAAYSCGYSSLSGFSKRYRQMYGEQPSQRRRTVQVEGGIH
jgi:AraC-like DNA-binding protein